MLMLCFVKHRYLRRAQIPSMSGPASTVIPTCMGAMIAFKYLICAKRLRKKFGSSRVEQMLSALGSL